MQPPDAQTMDYVVAIIVIGALAIGLLSMAVGRIVALWDRLITWFYDDPAFAQTAEPEPLHSPQQNHAEPQTNHGSGSAELVLNADEIAAVQRMIEHKIGALKPSKSSTIAAGFGISRGGSAAYQRASVIYDALFGQPEPAIKFPSPAGGTEPASYPVSGREVARH